MLLRYLGVFVSEPELVDDVLPEVIIPLHIYLNCCGNIVADRPLASA